jgi:predicted 3-demethylubiquinone-9 3-methyltransferase (glyoxalase superfamily)
MAALAPLTPCLWFDGRSLEAATFYTSIFPNSRILGESHYTEAGQKIHKKPAGSVMTVAFELNGQPFTALNGGPQYQFTEAISFQIACDTQEEVDHYWNKLGEGGDPKAQVCGWLKDKFGVSWQVFPKQLILWISDPDRQKAQRVTSAMMQMKKMDLEALRKAYQGG